MNILNVVPKSAAVLELLHTLKHPGHDDQSVHSGGGGGGATSAQVEAATAAQDKVKELQGQAQETRDAVMQAFNDGEIFGSEAEALDDKAARNQRTLGRAEEQAAGALEAYEAGDTAEGDRLLERAQDNINDARRELNEVRMAPGVDLGRVPGTPGWRD